MKEFLSLQQNLDILQDAYLTPGALKRTADKHDNSQMQISIWKRMVTGAEGSEEEQSIVLVSSKDWAKKTLKYEKAYFDAQNYKHIYLVFDTIRSSSQCLSIMMLVVELKKITRSPVSLHELSSHVPCWLVRVRIIYHHVIHVAQNTCHCDISIPDFVNYINHQLACGLFGDDFVVNIDETNIIFEMASELNLAKKGRKTVSLRLHESPCIGLHFKSNVLTLKKTRHLSSSSQKSVPRCTIVLMEIL